MQPPPRKPGSTNGNAMLTETLVKEIRLLHKQGFKQKELACMYSVSKGTIGLIVNNHTWRHIL